ncbi:SusE domain-containing protein [Pedobacter sp.]|jgi:hypothetical protein|uniref:SusE domain-containing protein n=1 Tax=Pedobacter sp. TaxID=1411316 RepID=UPI002C68C3D5|nr:SusE domain-containing protein [Pedobacter sp.]HWW40384.1 SusE domain-containing protein [Pedobacter sp.]
MKTYILSAACCLTVLLSFFGCKKDKEFKDVQVTEVTTFYSPDDAKKVLLTPTGTLYFEWEKSVAMDNGVVYYDVLFDKENGDFSKPIYTVPADNNGIGRGASVTHKILDRIGKFAGIGSGEEGTIKWTIVASRGISKVVSKQIRSLKITRLTGIEAPASLYLTGEGTEGGAQLAQALTVKSMSGGDTFEIYTKLLGGKSYKFVDSKTNVTRTFSVDNSGSTFKENADGATVIKDGIYRINLDFNAGTVSLQEITKLDFFMCTPQKRTTLTYQGKGTWKVSNMVPDFTSGGFGDDRYFFRMTIAGVDQKVGSSNIDNQPPAVKTGSYFNLFFYPGENNQWNYSFKFPNRTIQKCDVIVSFSAEIANYTHEIVY